MNILIIGEYSAFAKHLKAGFKKLGCKVTITMTGDSFKRLKGDKDDIFYSSKPFSLWGFHFPLSGTLSALYYNRFIKKELFKKYNNKRIDLIVVINYQFLSNNIFQLGVPISFVDKHIKNGTKLIMSICGGDPATRYTYPDKIKEWGLPLEKVRRDKRYSYLLRNANVIIPTTYSYYYAINKYVEYEQFDIEKICRAIPIPMTIEKECIINTCVGRKIVVFHGIIRPQMKGTYFIKPAMERIQAEFPDKVECICQGGMPYDEYIQLFDRVDILVDQATNNGWGVNAAIGAMKGKCVLVSCGKENSDNMGISDIPFVEIKRNEDNIYQTLKQLVLNPKEIDRLKTASRVFMEKYCDCAIIASRYLEAVGFMS